MTSISVSQQELSGVAVELWSCHSLHRAWDILKPGLSPERGGAVVYPVEHTRLTASKVLSVFLQCLIVKPH